MAFRMHFVSTDNAAIHHVQAVVNAILATGAVIIFLPPYSPDHIAICTSQKFDTRKRCSVAVVLIQN